MCARFNVRSVISVRPGSRIPSRTAVEEELMLNAKRGMLIAACAGTLVAAAFGCGPSIPDKIGFAGQNATLQSGTQVNFQDAWVTHDMFKVKLWVQNMSQ